MLETSRALRLKSAAIVLALLSVTGGGCVVSQEARYEAHLAAVVEPRPVDGHVVLAVATDEAR